MLHFLKLRFLFFLKKTEVFISEELLSTKHKIPISDSILKFLAVLIVHYTITHKKKNENFEPDFIISGR